MRDEPCRNTEGHRQAGGEVRRHPGSGTGPGIVVTTDEVHGDLHIIRKHSHAECASRWAMAEVYAKTLPQGQQPKTWGSPLFTKAANNRPVTEAEFLQRRAELVAVIDGKFGKLHPAAKRPRLDSAPAQE